MLTLVRGGEVYAPERLGDREILTIGDRIAAVADDGTSSISGIDVDEIDARGCIVVPGFVDAHSHLIGTGGEQGFASRTPEVPFDEIVTAGVTTVVGCLGTDDVTRHLAALLGRVRQLRRQGIEALMYTGSFHLPAPTLTGDVRSDLMLIPEVVGVGEVAIADVRSTEPTVAELARLASTALVGGLLGEKAGVVHLHVGPGKSRLSLLRRTTAEFDVPARHLYPTHIERSVELLDEAIAFARDGAFVDIDCIEPAGQWVTRYFERGGDPTRLTLTSDAHTPDGYETKLRDNLIGLVKERRCTLPDALALVTRNPAAALKLVRKGRLAPGMDADLVVLERDSFRIRHVMARGRLLLRDGSVLPPPTESFVVD